MNTSILKGKTILITRSLNQAKEMIQLINEYGGKTLTIPLLKFVRNPLQDDENNVLARLNSFQWLVFTSANAVKFFLGQLNEKQRTAIDQLNIAVVGKKTAECVTSYGLTVHLVPEPFSAKGLIHSFSRISNEPQSILLPVGQLSKPSLRLGLERQGHFVRQLVVYRTEMNDKNAQLIRQAVLSKAFDVATFTSPSSVEFFIQSLEGLDWQSHSSSVLVACIGSITEQAARDKGLDVTIVPNEFTAEALIKAIVDYYYQM